MNSGYMYSTGRAIESGGADNLSTDIDAAAGVFNIQGNQGVSMHLVVDNTSGASTGTAVGKWYGRVSNDGQNWVRVPHTGGDYVDTLSGADNNDAVDFKQLNFAFFKPEYVSTSGDGIGDVIVHVNRS